MIVEPRSFLGNERTFLAWVHMAMTLGGTAAILSSMCDVSIGSEVPVTGRFEESNASYTSICVGLVLRLVSVHAQGRVHERKNCHHV
jgi:uncharacterized membrane protein YidH (DUF202 family)